MAARYPTRYTLVALLLAIVIAAVAAAIGEGIRFARDLDGFGSRFEKLYPEAPLELTTEGNIAATAAFKEPISMLMPAGRLIVDPTGKTVPESIKDRAVLITSNEFIQCNDGSAWRTQLPLGDLWKPEKNTPITGASIRAFAPKMGWLLGVLAMIILALGNIAWASAMMFLVCPLVMVVASTGERPLVMPRRAAYRMCGASLIPLAIFGGVMHGAGYSVSEFWGMENAMLFWAFAAAAMAVWTGFMAKRMFSPPQNGPRTT